MRNARRLLLLCAVHLLAAYATACAEPEPGAATHAAPTAGPDATATAPVPLDTERPKVCAARGPRRLEAADTTEESSAIALGSFLGPDGARRGVVFVADEDARAIATLDRDTLAQIAVTELDGGPRHVRVLGDGRVAVTLAREGRVVLLEAGAHPDDPLEPRCSAMVAAEPWSMVERPGEVLVSSGFGGALTILETEGLSTRREIGLPREPRAVLIDRDQRRAFVTHAIGGVLSVVDLDDVTRGPEAISLRTGKILGDDEKRPRDASQGYAMARTRTTGPSPRDRLLVPHTSSDTGAAASVASWGYGTSFSTRPVAPIVAVVDPEARAMSTRGVVSAEPSGLTANCLLPRSAVTSGGVLYVACADLDAVVAYDATLTDPSAAPLRRFDAPPTPTSVALDGRALLVWSELARTLMRIDLDVSAPPGATRSVVLWARDGAEPSSQLLRGRYLFHTSRDTRIARGRACASCHPEGRDDGLVWSSPDGRRQTPMLAGRVPSTAPFGWSGEHPTLEEHLDHTFQRLDGIGLFAAPADLAALVAYVQSLPLPALPGRPTDGVARGRAVFDDAGCGRCHRDGGTDRSAHDVGSGRADGRRAFDTPSLSRVGRTAPYFHDGRYATLTDLLADPKTGMFEPATLSGDDRTALATYLETL